LATTAACKLEYDLSGQFVLAQSETLIPQGWSVHQIDQWVLGSHTKLPVIDMRSREGTQVGWLLGYAIHPELGLLSAASRVSLQCRLDDSTEVFERSLYELGGRFAAIHISPQASRLYLDPCGMLAAVFCPEQGIVASTLNLIPDSEGTREDHEIARVIGGLERDGWYPFGLTPRCGIERLLPNHYLDLRTWRAVRHWPTRQDLITRNDIAVAVSEIAGILERQVAAVVRVTPTYMSLTSGRHTRMVLACARDYVSRMTFYTIPLPDATADVDGEVARRIVRRFGLNYLPLQWEEPRSRELDVWMYRVGRCVAGRTSRTVRTLEQLDPTFPILSGQLGGAGAHYYWQGDDFERRHVSSSDLLERMGIPAASGICKRAESWLRGFPVEDFIATLDFLHFEVRFGSWAGPQEYGHPNHAFILSPYCHRRIFQRMLALPKEYRWRDRLADDLIASRWPELLGFPINEYPWSKLLLKHPKRFIRSALRDYFGRK
jgi:hypothetical protein